MKKITFYLFFLLFTQAYFAQENTVYYDDFNFDGNSGFTKFITSNPGNVSEANLIKRVDAVPTETVLGYTRPATNIPRGDERKLKSVNLIGNNGNGNFEADLWLVTEAIDISSLSNLILSFASRNRFNEGTEKPTVQLLATTNYDDGTDPSTVNWTDITSTIGDVTNTFYNDGNWALSYVDLSSFIAESGSDKFAVAFKAVYKNEGTFSATANRNGNWNLSDFKFAENSTLSTDDISLDSDVTVYPNPATSILNISNNSSADIKSASIVNLLGKTILKTNNTKTIDVSSVSKGMYILRLETSSNKTINKKIVLK